MTDRLKLSHLCISGRPTLHLQIGIELRTLSQVSLVIKNEAKHGVYHVSLYYRYLVLFA
jgi:hypothetical protein